MAFMKAAPQQARLKASMYGPPGSGKTFTTLLMAEGLARHTGGRIAYVDTERGTDFYAQSVAERKIHPEAFDFDALYTRSISDVLTSVRGLKPEQHSVVVLDSVSHLWEAAMDAYQGKKVGKSADKIPMHAWGSIKKPYKDLIAYLVGSPFHVFILGRQKNVFEEDDGEIRAAGVAMRAEGDTQYEPHLCLRMKGEDQAVRMYVEKDRTGVLAGRTFMNPSFATIEPLLKLLGDVQAQPENEEERQAKDAELLEAQERKAEKRLAESRALLATLTAQATAASNLEELGQVKAEANKKKRSLSAEDTASLRAVFDAVGTRMLDATEVV